MFKLNQALSHLPRLGLLNPNLLLWFFIVTFVFLGKANAQDTMFELSQFSNNVVAGTSKTSESALTFKGEFFDRESPTYEVTLTSESKTWITTIALINEEKTDITVSAKQIRLNEVDRELLFATANKLSEHAYTTQNDTLLMRLVTQMMFYWSKSPDNYIIENGKLGG